MGSVWFKHPVTDVSCHNALIIFLYYMYSTSDRGVGDDVTNVTVKPYVLMKDSFMLAKPATRTQPTWTDLVLTCDAGTNTQVCSN